MRGFLLFLLLLAGLTSFAEAIPVFEKPDSFSRIVGTIDESVLSAVSESQAITGFSARHPLTYYNQFYPVTGGYASPEILLRPDAEGVPEPIQAAVQPMWRTLLYCVAGIALAAVLLTIFRLKQRGKLATDSTKEALLYCAGIVLFRQFLLLSSVINWNNVIASAADDPGYFQTAAGFLNGDFTGPWNFTIGNGFFYIPFILATGAKEFYDIAIPFAYFSGLVLAPAALILGFMILRRLGLSNIKAAVAMLLWAVSPFFVYHAEMWNTDTFFSFFALPPEPGNWWKYYRMLINAGFNAMSDTPSLVLVLGTIVCTLYLPAKRKFALLLGFLFGLSCLVRINNIFFAPVLLYLATRNYGDQLRSWKGAFLLAGIAAAGFFAGFGMQLWINFHQFGHPLTFGYVLHYQDWAEGSRPANGFTWGTFFAGKGVRLLSGANHALWVLGAAALLCLRNRALRTTFALWAIPVIWFFFGYSHTFCDAQRFIVGSVPAFLGAFCAIECWNSLPRRATLLIGILMAAALILSSQTLLLSVALAGIGCRLWKSQRQAALLCLSFALLVYACRSWGYVVLFALFFIRALADWGIELYQSLRKKETGRLPE